MKGVEFGLGFEQTRRLGSAVMDVIEGRDAAGDWGRATNNAGGLEGGISNGQPIVIRGAVKPISTLPRPLPSADLVTGQPVDKGHYERSDISVVPADGCGRGGDGLPDPRRLPARQVRWRLRRRDAEPIWPPTASARSPGPARPAAPRVVPPLPRASRPWISCSWGCPAAARASLGAAWPRAAMPSSWISTT